MFQLMTVSPKVASGPNSPQLTVSPKTAEISFNNVSFDYIEVRARISFYYR